jgi:ABC-type uncharacterized transport system permease subunit
MLERIEIMCFAASYSVALVLELTRLFFRSGLRGMLMIVFAGAGLLAHTLFLVQRYRVDRLPLSSAFDWYLVAAWVLVIVYLYLTIYHRKHPIGLFLLPLVLALIAVATFLADRAPFPLTLASRYWGAVHGAFLLLGTIGVMLGFVAGMMYLIQAYRLKHKLLTSHRLQLPSLEWLARLNARAIVASSVMLGLGVLSGAVLNAINHGRNIDQLPWTDPVVLSTNVTLVWLICAAAFALAYKPARQGRKVAYLTVASFVFLVISLGISLLLNTRHGTAGSAAIRGEQRAEGAAAP